MIVFQVKDNPLQHHRCHIPPPLPPPAPAPTNVVSVGTEPKFRGEASVIISMADGSYVRQWADDPLTMPLLFQRDSATAEQVSKAMEDGLHDGTSKSGNDTSYTRAPVTELPSTYSSDSEGVLQPINASTSSNATMVD